MLFKEKKIDKRVLIFQGIFKEKIRPNEQN
jgi:hypothetical protein